MKVFVVVSLLLTLLYIASIPWSGSVVNVDNAPSATIAYKAECSQKKSSPNMSLHLAILNTGVMGIITLLMLSHTYAKKGRGTLWPIPVLWISVLIAFIAQLILFGSLVTRIGVWFLSCRSLSKSEGACPVTRFENAHSSIYDREQCRFHAVDLIPYTSSDTYVTCQPNSTNDYFQKYAHFDLPQYYSRKAVCSLDLEDDIGAIDWCWNWGCSRQCSPDTYYKNFYWFTIDILSFLTVVTGYMFMMNKWEIQTEKQKV